MITHFFIVWILGNYIVAAQKKIIIKINYIAVTLLYCTTNIFLIYEQILK